jgi:hypothetical protein
VEASDVGGALPRIMNGLDKHLEVLLQVKHRLDFLELGYHSWGEDLPDIQHQ